MLSAAVVISTLRVDTKELKYLWTKNVHSFKNNYSCTVKSLILLIYSQQNWKLTISVILRIIS